MKNKTTDTEKKPMEIVKETDIHYNQMRIHTLTTFEDTSNFGKLITL